MFKMVVEDAIKVGNHIAFDGKCENKKEFSYNLIDDDGNKYFAQIPLDKTLIFFDDRISLFIKSEMEAKDMIGKTLRLA